MLGIGEVMRKPGREVKAKQLAAKVFVVTIALAALVGCWRPGGIGVGGKYIEAVDELTKSRKGGDPRKAIAALHYVVRKDPEYRDSLTQLGRAYYYAGRYTASYEVLKRALIVNEKDELAWLVMGLTQLRQNDDERGLKSYKGGLSLLAKATHDGYKDFSKDFWDDRGTVRRALRRNISLARKGISAKARLLVAGEDLLYRIDRGLREAESDRDAFEYREHKKGRKDGD